MVEQHYKIRIKQNGVEIEVEGDKEFVEKHIEEFKKEIPKIAKGLSLKKKPVVSEIPKEKLELEKLSLAEFYKRKQPKEDLEVALTIAYYFRFHNGKEEFSNKQIKKETQNLIHKLSNIPGTLKNAASGKKAYVTKVSKGKWKLTLDGEELVEKKLPKISEK